MRKILFTALIALPLAACDSDKKEEADTPEATKPAETAKTYECRAMITKASSAEPVKGEASGEDEAAVNEEAWNAACAKLPDEAQASCGPDEAPEGWSWSGGGGSVTSDGKKTYSKNITLTPKSTEFSGEGTSTTSQDEACKLAYAKACEAAGATAGCESQEGFTNNGTMKSKTTGLGL